MDTKKIRKFLGWCAVINYAMVFIVVAIGYFAHDLVYEFSLLFFNVSVETYDAIVIGTLAAWELLIWFGCIIPYVVLRFIIKK